jgi:hypothetical protein
MNLGPFRLDLFDLWAALLGILYALILAGGS